MAKRKQPLRERLEKMWTRRPPDPETGTEMTAEGLKVRTPSRDEFLSSLEKASKPKK